MKSQNFSKCRLLAAIIAAMVMICALFSLGASAEDEVIYTVTLKAAVPSH